MPENTRRSFIKAAGAVTAATATGAVVVNSTAADTASGWTEVSSPTSKTLYGVSMTNEGPVAVGKTGNILKRTSGGWIKVVDAGPATRNNSLRSVAVTDDGKRVWYVGGSGAMGAYDVSEGVKYNYSAPSGKTSTWEAITVTGNRENETVFAANGSGEVMRLPTDSKGCLITDTSKSGVTVQKPGSGSTIPAIDFRENGTKTGHAIDTSANAFVTNDDGTSYEDIGIPDSQVNLFDTISYEKSDGTERVYVAGGGGKLYRLECRCSSWTPIQLGTKDLKGVTRNGNTNNKLVCGAAGSIYEKLDGSDWKKDTSYSSSTTLYEAAYGGSDYPDVIVGGGGTILER